MLLTHKAASQKNNASDVYPTFAAMYLDQAAAKRKIVRERYVGCEARYRCEL